MKSKVFYVLAMKEDSQQCVEFLCEEAPEQLTMTDPNSTQGIVYMYYCVWGGKGRVVLGKFISATGTSAISKYAMLALRGFDVTKYVISEGKHFDYEFEVLIFGKI